MTRSRLVIGALVIATAASGVVGCSQSTAAPGITVVPAPRDDPAAAATSPGAQPRLAADPAQLADGLVADELALRDPATPGTFNRTWQLGRLTSPPGNPGRPVSPPQR